MKKKLTITLSIILPILLIGIGVGVYFAFFTPNAQAKRIADQTIQAAFTQQEGVFKAHGTPEGSTNFYKIAGQRNYKLESFAQDGSSYYALYRFTDESEPALGRIGVENGQVISFATGQKLAAIPKNDPEQETQTASVQNCLARNDLAYLDSTSLYAKTFRGATMIFADDTSTTYSGEENATQLLDRMANFYDKTKDKDYKFLVRGYLAATLDTLDARKQVIQNRTTKIQKDLVDRKIAEDRIDIGEPVAYPVDQPTDGQNERYVIIDVINSCIK
jgi:hypothetical protein